MNKTENTIAFLRQIINSPKGDSFDFSLLFDILSIHRGSILDVETGKHLYVKQNETVPENLHPVQREVIPGVMLNGYSQNRFGSFENKLLSVIWKLRKLERATMDNAFQIIPSKSDTLIAMEENLTTFYGDCAVLLMDIDGMGLINEKFGRELGREVILNTYRRILDTVERYVFDHIVGSYGGDEFILLMRSETYLNVKSISDEIRASVEHNFYSFSNESFAATISIGFVFLNNKPDSDITITVLLHKVEQMLAYAKKVKNCVVGEVM